MRFQKYLRASKRGVTPQRLAAARRHLAKKREAMTMPLFPTESAVAIAELPSPEERIEGFDEGHFQWQIETRQRRAKSWKKARAILASLCDRDRIVLLDAWNRGGQPGSPEYLLGHIDRFFSESRKRLDAGERWYVFQVQDTRRVLLWKPGPLLPTAIAGPFDDYLDAIHAMEQI